MVESSSSPVLVTGATGNVGRHVVEGLLAAGYPVRAAAGSREQVAALFADRVEAVELDFTDRATWGAAYAGVPIAFVMRPPQLGNVRRDMLPSLEAARSAGVQHVVLLSLQGAERNRLVPHATLEAWLRASGLAWTFVRPSFFMENLSTTHAADIRDSDEIVVPAGRGRTSFVAASDVAAVATAALLDPQAHRGRAWTPTGPQALSYDEVATVLSEVTGRSIHYTAPGVLRYAWHASSVLGLPAGMVLVTSAIYSVARAGRAAGRTDDVRRVTGRDPIDLRGWAREHAAAWVRP